MKKLLPSFFLFLFLIPSALAIYGGEKITYHIDSCESLNVTIKPYQEYEWSVTPNCSDHKSGKWICNCTDDWDITLKPKINSVGTFNITIIYIYSKPEVKEIIKFEYPVSGGRVRYRDIVLNLTKEIEKIVYRNQTMEIPVYYENETKLVEANLTIQELNETIQSMKPSLLDHFITTLGLFMLVELIIVLALLIKYRKSIIPLIELLKK